MELDGFGEADRFAAHALEAGTQRPMRAFNLLRIAFPRHLGFRSPLPRICPPLIGEEMCAAKGLQQGSALQDHLVLSTTKPIRSDFLCSLIAGMPQPPWRFLLPHNAPHFIDRRGLAPTNAYCHVAGTPAVDQGSISRREGRPFFFNS